MNRPARKERQVPRLPSEVDEPGVRDIKSIAAGSAHSPDSTPELVKQMAEHMPFLPEVLAAPTVKAQLAIVERNVRAEAFGKAIKLFSVIEHFYLAKDKKLPEALRLAQLKYELATRMPEDRPPDDRDLSRERQIGDALQSIANCYTDMGLKAKALDYLLQAETHLVQDQEERAVRNLPPMCEFDRLFGGRPAIAHLFESIARLYEAMGDEKKQEAYFDKMRIAEQGCLGPEQRVDRAVSLGLQAEHEGDFDSALGAYHEALDIALANARNTVVTRAPATACHHIGEVMARLGLFRKALWYHREALAMNLRSGHLPRLRHDHFSIGRIYAQRPQYGDAKAEFEAALECASVAAQPGDPFAWSNAKGRFRVIDPDLAWEPALEIGRQYRKAKDFVHSQEFFALAIALSEAARSSVLNEQHRIGVQGRRSEAYNEMVSLHAALAASPNGEEKGLHARKALEFAERGRGRAFLDSIGMSPIAAPPSVRPELLAQEATLLERVRQIQQGANSAGGANQASGQQKSAWDEYEQARLQLDKVWQGIACDGGAANYVAIRRGNPVDWEGLTGLLRSEGAAGSGARRTVLAEYFDTGDEWLLIVARGEDASPAVIPLSPNRNAMRDALLHHLGNVANGRSVSLQDLQPAIGNLLKPLRDYTAKDDLIWFVPHGLLHFVPFHALEFEGAPLMERNPVCYSPSASVMKYCRNNRRPNRGSAIILADSHPEMPLLFARGQASAIRSILGSRRPILIGSEATASALKQALSKDGPFDIVHFACHGIFESEEALASGVLLSPEREGEFGVLTARELLGWHIPANLVTLSACQSGLSERLAGDELIGLTRALLHAGAASVSVSLWSVDEISTSIFMQFFYQEMKSKDKAEAMRQAAIRLRRLRANEAIQHCEATRTLWPSPEYDLVVEQDIASFEFRARDFDAALARYSRLRSRLPESSPEFERTTAAMARCRLALKSGARPEYSVCPFSDAYYWAPFILVGSWL
jgi:CHAT domain-containing protein